MYFVARKVSLPSIEALQKRERTDSDMIYQEFSQQLNDLINTYFRTENEGKSPFTLITLWHRNDGDRDCGLRGRTERSYAFALHRFAQRES